MAPNTNHAQNFLRILIQFCLLFHFSSSAGVTIISYPDLANDFAVFMSEYKYFQNNVELPDPYSDEVKSELRNVCGDIGYARTFEILAKDQNEMRNVLNFDKSEDISDGRTVDYEDVKVRIYDFEDDIPMFPCYKDPAYGYVFVTPGFNQDFKFLLRRRDLTSNPILYALVEPRPAIDESFNDQRHLEKYFVQVYRMFEPQSKNRLSTSTLNGYQLFRLCSLLEDARRIYADSIKLKKKDSKKKDSPVLDMEHHIGLGEIVDVSFEHLNKLNPVYATLELNVATVPCYSGDSEDRKDTFLVSENPDDLDSVFVLELRINADSKKREVFVVQHVRNIALLKNLDTFYKK